MRKETTTLDNLFSVLDIFEMLSCRYWLDGGWGVDALVGRQTRDHRDVDIDFDASRFDEVLDTLEAKGYAIDTDERPVRVELYCDSLGYLDIHPFVLNDDGTSKQANSEGGWYEFIPEHFGTAVLEGRTIPCISPLGQKVFHSGYEPRDVDIHDLELIDSLTEATPQQANIKQSKAV